MSPEDRFVERLKALLPAAGPDVLVGPGDDAAVLFREAGLLAATTDLLVEEIDFLPGEDPERLGRRAAAVNLSDLAAMGAAPEFFLLAIGLPKTRGEEYALSVARGAIARGGEFGARLVGGDLSSAPRALVCVALWGRPAGQPLRRSGARPGDAVFVSGQPGQAAAGLRMAQRIAAFAERGSQPTPRFPEISAGDQERLLAAYHDPVPRVALGLELVRRGLATAAIDVSDGLGIDAGRLARASGVRIVLERERLPLSRGLASFATMEDLDPVDLALSGGDDYELLFTAEASRAGELPGLAHDLGLALTRIGRVETGAGASLRDGSIERDVSDLGYDHLEERP